MHYTLIPLAFHGLKKCKHIKDFGSSPTKVLAFGPMSFHTALVHSGCPLTESLAVLRITPYMLDFSITITKYHIKGTIMSLKV